MLKQLTLLSSILFFAVVSWGQKNSISILNNRFFFTFPDSARNVARGADIMAADPNINIETRVIYDMGDKRIVFFAQELYLRSVPDLQNKLLEESSNDYPFEITTIYNRDSVQCIRMAPQKFDDKKEAILVNSLIIKNADNTISRMSVYLNPKAFADKKTFDKIINDVFDSFRKGTKRLALTAHTESYKILGTKNEMAVELPAGYILTKDSKYDFEVYKIRKVRTYGDTLQADLTIYFGFYPSLFNAEYELEKFKKPDTDGEFMSQKIKWMNFQDDSRGLIVREQLFTDDDIQKDAKMHIAMISNNQGQIEELTKVINRTQMKYNK